MSFDHLFSSDRLLFRAFDNSPENKAYFHDLTLNDPTSLAQSSNSLLKPPSTDDIDKMFNGAADTFLSVTVYLKQEVGQPTASTPPVGWLSLDSHPKSRHHRSCSLGITISTEYQGKGYGTEAIVWAVDWAFRVAGMHAVYAHPS
jgi:RimJ/RimL family protein N-acetyltransferase